MDGERQILPAHTKRKLLAFDICRAAETIGAVYDSGVVTVAVGTAEVIFETLPTPAAEYAVDPLQRPFWVVWTLHGYFIVVVIVPVLAPLIDISNHVIKSIMGKISQIISKPRGLLK